MSYSGKHTWLAPVIIKSKCAINIKNFPFDEQRCTLKFGSWTYDGFRLNLMNESATADLGTWFTFLFASFYLSEQLPFFNFMSCRF